MAGTRIIRVSLAAGTALALTATSLAGPAAAASPRTSQVASDAAWIRQGQLPDGAIAWYVDRQRINPYLANYAAIGLAEAYRVTRTTADLTAATSWLRWYAAHEDASGFVTDYTVSDGVETSTGDMDSTDAYAGTFLLAVRAAAREGANIRSLSAGIHGAVSAIEATQDSDGLTWAKPTWHVKYLMDESEVYAGLKAAVELGADLNDHTLRTRALADENAVAAGVSSLWDAPTGAYDWARSGGSQNTTDWANLYSDSMEQAWAATFGVAGTQGASLLATVDADHPLWDQPAATDTINGAPSAVGYWPVAGWGFLENGSAARAATAATNIRTAAQATNRAWPFTTGDAGQLIVLESADVSLVG